MTTTTADLRITPFHNCSTCIGEVKRALRRLDGVELLDTDSQNGKFTIRTTRNPEEIRAALQRKFPDKSVFLSNIKNHSNPSSALINPRNSPIQGPLNYHHTEAVVAVARANGAQSVEFRQSNAIIFTFDNQATTSGTATNAPPPQQQQQDQPTTFGSAWADENVGGCNGDFGYGYVQPPPSAPPQEQDFGYGYVPPPQQQNENVGSYVGGHNGDFGYGYVDPRPQQPTTSGSARADVYGGARYEDFGHGSAPLIATAETQGYVVGHPYPIQRYRDGDYSRVGCCTIV